MGIKSGLAKIFSHLIYQQSKGWRKNGFPYQKKIFNRLIFKGKDTLFGKNHQFAKINSIKDFQTQVPVRDYEEFKGYIEEIKLGHPNVLWPGTPLYLSTTSGTTSGIKYIPITRSSIRNQIKSARNALLFYIQATGNVDFLNGKLIFLSGSPVLNHLEKIPTGRLSGIINHHIPPYLKQNQVPSYSVNSIEDWEKKMDAITDETLDQDLRLISGIPPWVQMYFDRIYQKTGKLIKDIFPNFSLFVYGGVNFEPYRNQLSNQIGKEIDSLETYPASEGFFAFQDQRKDPGLLLLLDSGIFYEFIPLGELGMEGHRRLTINEIQLYENYALVITTNAGLWAYLVGDTLKFISKNPYRILVTGRIKHFISAFGEHVIAEEVEGAIQEVAGRFGVTLVDFSVAPQVNPPWADELPYHEWFIEFGKAPIDIKIFSIELDKTMQQKNHYYMDLIEGNILQPLKIRILRENAFIDYMKDIGKLGGQNKVPHLTNHREIAQHLEKYNFNLAG